MENNCIVLADKHPSFLEGLRGLLETVFGGVVMVADQPSLIEALNKIKPDFAIIDVSLLNHGDLSTACDLIRRFPDIKIVILSDHNEPDLVEEFISAGIAGFVFKQHAGTDLFEAIESVRQRQNYISPIFRSVNDI